jgi:hypothetical protein
MVLGLTDMPAGQMQHMQTFACAALSAIMSGCTSVMSLTAELMQKRLG